LHESFGTNWRMIEVQAAIGRIQLRRMADWQATRLRHARRIWTHARTLPGLRVPAVPDFIDHAAYKCYVFLDPKALASGWTRERIMQAITDRGVPVYSGSCSEIYLEKAFDGTAFRPTERLPVARALGDTSLMFLVHPTLQGEHIDRTCDVMGEVMAQAAA
jgi:dTDP-4-amino-4,6-dideoxygalactose transaminase